MANIKSTYNKLQELEYFQELKESKESALQTNQMQIKNEAKELINKLNQLEHDSAKELKRLKLDLNSFNMIKNTLAKELELYANNSNMNRHDAQRKNTLDKCITIIEEIDMLKHQLSRCNNRANVIVGYEMQINLLKKESAFLKTLKDSPDSGIDKTHTQKCIEELEDKIELLYKFIKDVNENRITDENLRHKYNAFFEKEHTDKSATQLTHGNIESFIETIRNSPQGGLLTALEKFQEHQSSIKEQQAIAKKLNIKKDIVQMNEELNTATSVLNKRPQTSKNPITNWLNNRKSAKLHKKANYLRKCVDTLNELDSLESKAFEQEKRMYSFQQEMNAIEKINGENYPDKPSPDIPKHKLIWYLNNQLDIIQHAGISNKSAEIDTHNNLQLKHINETLKLLDELKRDATKSLNAINKNMKEGLITPSDYTTKKDTLCSNIDTIKRYKKSLVAFKNILNPQKPFINRAIITRFPFKLMSMFSEHSNIKLFKQLASTHKAVEDIRDKIERLNEVSKFCENLKNCPTIWVNKTMVKNDMQKLALDKLKDLYTKEYNLHLKAVRSITKKGTADTLHKIHSIHDEINCLTIGGNNGQDASVKLRFNIINYSRELKSNFKKNPFNNKFSTKEAKSIIAEMQNVTAPKFEQKPTKTEVQEENVPSKTHERTAEQQEAIDYYNSWPDDVKAVANYSITLSDNIQNTGEQHTVVNSSAPDSPASNNTDRTLHNTLNDGIRLRRQEVDFDETRGQHQYLNNLSNTMINTPQQSNYNQQQTSSLSLQ